MELHALETDITTLDTDAIVNAANPELRAGGGVCGAIHLAAGPELAVACAAVGGCPCGEARITPGFRLPARYIIHAVGPIWEGGDAGEDELLARAYRASLVLARDNGCHGVAFPAISTGIYGFPLHEATRIAVREVRAFAEQAGTLERVLFACFSTRTLEAYRAAGVLG